MPITVGLCKFSKIVWGSMPPDPPRIIFVSLIASNLTLPEKIRFKNVKIWSQKVLNILPSWTHFLKRANLLCFSGLTSLHSVNIQPYSKRHPPSHQNLLNPPLLGSRKVWRCPDHSGFSDSSLPQHFSLVTIFLCVFGKAKCKQLVCTVNCLTCDKSSIREANTALIFVF